MGRCFSERSFSLEKGGGLEEGGLEIHPGRRLADDGKRPPGLMDVLWAVASRREVFF